MESPDKEAVAMTRPIHTPGPVWLDDDGRIAAGKGDEYVTLADPHPGNLTMAQDGALGMGNTRLLAAAYNAFDSAARRLGVNAVELAERMQEGDLYELVRSLRDVAGRLRNMVILSRTSEETKAPDFLAIKKVEALLDKVYGSAS
jgi:hypothetical protein